MRSLANEMIKIRDKLTERENDITKSNEIIKKMNKDCKHLASKVRTYETELQENKNLNASNLLKIENLNNELKQNKNELEEIKNINKEIHHELSEKTNRIDELTEKEQTSQNVIAWLHKQLNEMQVSHQVIRYNKQVENKSVSMYLFNAIS
ncbi:spindle assembly abnormal protein 6 homolog [Octopus sinensis]|uniref:Spindle assembly abnormal protein 6 homolog n=1 Tax=Octopus sinensis TaxID=2607531 RepID=A0A7E6EJM6_9MOLL|nr:spindle assembly abnormal protein 6 homolog [Octopus sinensis]